MGKGKEKRKRKRKEATGIDEEQGAMVEEEQSSDEPMATVSEKRRKKKKKKKKNDEEGDPNVPFNDSGRPSEDVPEWQNKQKRKRKATEDSVADSSPVDDCGAVQRDGCHQKQPSASHRKRKKRKRDQIEVGTIPTCANMRASPLQGDEEVVHLSSKSQPRKAVKPKVAENDRPKENTRRVRFSGNVEVFPSDDESKLPKGYNEPGGLIGKRFTHGENELIKETVFKIIKEHDLGDEGLHKILHSKKFPEARGWTKELAAMLPWRKKGTLYKKVHMMFTNKTGKWTPEEIEIINRHHEMSGSTWKDVECLTGRFRDHIKDAWRRYRLPNRKKGRWSQDEYQRLFDLVNLDLRMKVASEKKSKSPYPLRDDIAWYSISNKHATRGHTQCCTKWYNQLSSPMVAQGLWADCDDYLLIDALQSLDACCVEDVDWDHLLEQRSGDVCRKRWMEMTLHIGGYREKSFVEQVDVLAARYCPEMYKYRNVTTEDEDVE